MLNYYEHLAARSDLETGGRAAPHISRSSRRYIDRIGAYDTVNDRAFTVLRIRSNVQNHDARSRGKLDAREVEPRRNSRA